MGFFLLLLFLIVLGIVVYLLLARRDLHKFDTYWRTRLQKFQLDDKTEQNLLPLLRECRVWEVTFRLMWVARLNLVAALQIAEDMERDVREQKYQRDYYTNQLRLARLAQYDTLLGLLHYFDVRQALTEVDQMDRQEFEYYVADLLRHLGYTGTKVCLGEKGLGVDIIAHREDKHYAIQCRNPRYQVGADAVQQVQKGKENLYFTHSVVVTNHHFTREAIDEAAKTGTLLWDRGRLGNMIAESMMLSAAEVPKADGDQSSLSKDRPARAKAKSPDQPRQELLRDGVLVVLDSGALEREKVRIEDLELVRIEDSFMGEEHDHVKLWFTLWYDDNNGELKRDLLAVMSLYRGSKRVTTMTKRIDHSEFYKKTRVEITSGSRSVLEGLTRVEVTVRKAVI